MRWTQRKIVAGVVAGLVLTVGGFGMLSAQSQDKTDLRPRYCVTQDERPDGQPPKMTTDEVAQHIAESFGVDAKQVKSALDEQKDFRDIGRAAMLAKISGKSFADVMALKTDDKDWRDIESSLGVTREKVRQLRIEMTAKDLSRDGVIDEEGALKLLKDGYEPWDISCASILAEAAGKDIQSVLDLKKINNRWGDVADQLGVDHKELKKFHGPGPHGMGRHDGLGPDMMGGPMMDD
ncbi:Tat pathway signal sequence domain protein [Mitsuokella multacida]|mgnify:FL=1|uniref:Tat pathway signal sequence domain protein n=1 Tax=Mitsuokella multacida TaxID=52226 RepID=UPI0025991DCB|nr:Tat pathway signal sequence domain protein [Mitsuokella multacida]